MSDLTYGIVQDMTGLIWGTPVNVGSRTFASTVRAGYGIIMNDIVGLAMPPMARIEASPVVAHAGTCIQSRSLRLAEAAGLSIRSANVSMNTGPIRLNSPTETVRSLGHAVGLQAAPPVISRTHDLLTRSELTCAKAEALVPASPLLAATRARLEAADAAIAGGVMDDALSAAETAMRAAAELEEQVARALAAELADARRAADRIARAGALWTGLHTDESVHAWLARNARTSLEQVVEKLRGARERYKDGEFSAAEELATEVEAELSALIDRAFSAIAVKQRDHMALEAAQALQELGYNVGVAKSEDRRVVSATRGGRLMLTVAFDTEGHFEIDSRAGYKGSTACSVAVNDVLKALAEKMKLDVEGRTFVADPGDDPGRSVRTCAARRRLSTADMLEETEYAVTGATYNQQALMAAWATVAQ